MKFKTLLTLLITCVLLNARGDITNNLVTYLKLDDLAGLAAVDSTGNGNSGTLINFPSDNSEWTANGRINGALICNTGTVTNEYVSVANTANLNFDTSLTFTLAAWVKLSTTTQVSGGGIIAKGTGGGGEEYDLDINAGKFRIVLRNSGGTATSVSSGLTPAANTWYHVVVVYNASGTNRICQIYVNGQVNATMAAGSVPTTLKANTHVVSIGAREASATSGYTFPFKGTIDEVRIYNRALSTNDVYELYSSNGKAPILTTQPRSVAGYVGDMPIFSVGVDQNNSIVPVGYQWLFNGSPISGATSATLLVTNVQLASAGAYSVQVSNVIGITTSSNATLQVSSLPSSDIVNNLVGNWKMDDGSGATTAVDSTPNANTATLLNFADFNACWTNGLIGGALTFNADASASDVVLIPGFALPAPDVLDFAANPTFTLAAWVNGSTLQTNSSGIIAKGTGNGGEQYTVDVSGGHFRFYVRNTNGTSFNLNTTVSPNNTWQHLAAVLNATNGIMNLYINGQLAGVAVAPFSLLTNAHEVSIGNRQSGTAGYNQPFTGLIDDVRIYNRDLTSADIQALYLTGGVYPPSFVTQPASASLYAGDNLKLSGTASGTAPFTYQWVKNGANLAAATNSSLIFQPLQLSDAGNYTLVVSNAYGAATSSVANVQVQAFYVTNALAGYWKFDDGSGSYMAVDSSANGNNASLYNFPDYTSEWVTGRIDGAVQFNSGSTSEYAMIPDSPSLNFDTNLTFTLSAWVKGPSAQANGAGIIAKGFGGLNEQYTLDVHTDQLSTPAYRFYVRNVSGASTALTTPVTPNGQWQHLVATYDGKFTTMSIYVNGQLVASNTAAPGTLLVDNNHEVSIGNRESSSSSGYNFPFAGTIDDVRIYNRALSAADVQTLYNAFGGLAPVFYTQPLGASKYVGDNLVLSAFVDGNAPLTYQWQKNGVSIPSATTSSLVITNLQLSDAGTYTLAVTNAAGFGISSNAVVQVTSFSLANPVAWWKFDETSGSTAADSSVSGNTGSLVNFPGDDSEWVAGRVNGALNFNADGSGLTYLTVPDAASLNFTNSQALSLAAWVKGPATQVGNAGIIAKGYGGAEQYAIDINGGFYRFYVRGANGASVNAQSSVGPNGRWQLVVATFDAYTGLLSLYVNGQLAASITGPNSLLYNTHAVSIGSRESSAVSGFNWPFTGAIDDVRLFDHAMQASEVQSLYSAAGTLAPVFYTQPQGTNVYSGQTVKLTALVDGSDPLAYQWLKNGVSIPGATNLNLVFTNLAPSDAGNYSLRVTNSAGTATSSLAALQVQSFSLSGMTHLSDGNFQFSGTGPANASYSILATTNVALPLSQWTVLTTGTFDANGQFTFTDLNATNKTTQFYRVSTP